MQKEVKDIYREQGDAIEQETLERIRADLWIATLTVNKHFKKDVDRQKPKKKGENRHS